MTESSVGHLEDEAIKRRERLNDLKRKRNGNNTNQQNHNEGKIILPKPQFRSYKPLNKKLNDFVLDRVEPGDVSSQIKIQLESAKSAIVIDQLDVTALAPRKPDWDLKRDVAKKLAKLDKQTHKAIAELIRDRLKDSEHGENLAAIVSAGATNDN